MELLLEEALILEVQRRNSLQSKHQAESMYRHGKVSCTQPELSLSEEEADALEPKTWIEKSFKWQVLPQKLCQNGSKGIKKNV